MRMLLVPFIAVGVLTGSGPDGPSPDAMRSAYQSALESQVRNALDFVAETGGPEAAAKVRAAGGDRFDIRAFQKLDCTRNDTAAGYRCAFRLTVALSNGVVEQTLTGRFFDSPAGLAFSEDI